MSFYDRQYIQWYLNTLLDLSSPQVEGLPIPEVIESDMVGFGLLIHESKDMLHMTKEEFQTRHLFAPPTSSILLPTLSVLKLLDEYHSKPTQSLALIQVWYHMLQWNDWSDRTVPNRNIGVDGSRWNVKEFQQVFKGETFGLLDGITTFDMVVASLSNLCEFGDHYLTQLKPGGILIVPIESPMLEFDLLLWMNHRFHKMGMVGTCLVDTAKNRTYRFLIVSGEKPYKPEYENQQMMSIETFSSGIRFNDMVSMLELRLQTRGDWMLFMRKIHGVDSIQYFFDLLPNRHPILVLKQKLETQIQKVIPSLISQDYPISPVWCPSSPVYQPNSP